MIRGFKVFHLTYRDSGLIESLFHGKAVNLKWSWCLTLVAFNETLNKIALREVVGKRTNNFQENFQNHILKINCDKDSHGKWLRILLKLNSSYTDQRDFWKISHVANPYGHRTVKKLNGHAGRLLSIKWPLLSKCKYHTILP